MLGLGAPPSALPHLGPHGAGFRPQNRGSRSTPAPFLPRSLVARCPERIWRCVQPSWSLTRSVVPAQPGLDPETHASRSCDLLQKRRLHQPTPLSSPLPASLGPQRPHPRRTPTNRELPASSCPSLGCRRTQRLQVGGHGNLSGALRKHACRPHAGPPESELGGKLKGPVHPLVDLSRPQCPRLEKGTARVPTFRVVLRSHERKQPAVGV